MKVTEYVLVSETGAVAFNKKVNELIEDGWQPFGGVTSFFIELPKNDGTHVEIGMEYGQAMVKYNDSIKV